MEVHTKVCTKCGKELPATSEFFRKTGKWLRGSCRLCEKKYNKKNREKNKKKHDHDYYEKMFMIWEKEKYMKKCYSCSKLKKYDNFHKHRKTIDGLSCLCKECNSKKGEKRRETNTKSHNWKYYRKMVKIWDVENYHKKCYKCGKVKFWRDFSCDVTRKDGISNRCTNCDKECHKNYYKKYPNKKKEALQYLNDSKWTLRNLGLSDANLRVGKGYSQYDISKEERNKRRYFPENEDKKV